MSESEFQKRLFDNLVSEEGEVNTKLGDKDLTVIVECNGRDAAYTADEARDLARDVAYEIDIALLGRDRNIVDRLRELADTIEAKQDNHRPCQQNRS